MTERKTNLNRAWKGGTALLFARCAVFLLVAVCLHLSVSSCLADKRAQALAPGGAPIPADFGMQVLTSDFDLDSLADDAYFTSRGTLKSIALRMGNSRFSYFSFSTATSTQGTLRASDIDHDDDIDLIWFAPGLEAPTILLGDGKGNFTRLEDRDQALSSLFLSLQSQPRADSVSKLESIQPLVKDAGSFTGDKRRRIWLPDASGKVSGPLSSEPFDFFPLISPGRAPPSNPSL